MNKIFNLRVIAPAEEVDDITDKVIQALEREGIQNTYRSRIYQGRGSNYWQSRIYLAFSHLGKKKRE